MKMPSLSDLQKTKEELELALAELDNLERATRNIELTAENGAAAKNETERAREARQERGFQPALGQCETTGFETRMREECEEITELECKNVNITLYRTELRPRCKTMFDQTCNVTYTEMPANKCSQVKKKK